MKRKILFLHYSMPIGGAEAVLINYLNIAALHPDYQVELALLEPSEQYNMDKIDPKVKVHFILSEAESQFLRYNHWKVKDNSGDEVAYHKGWLDHLVESRRERLTKLIDEQQYDVVIDFHNCIVCHLGKEFISSINRPYIYWIHANSDFDLWKEKLDLCKPILNKCNVFVSICKDMEITCQKVLREDFNLSGKTVKIIFNPIDINRIIRTYDNYLEEDNELFNQPFILQVARLNEEQKNHTKLIELYAKLKAKGIKEKL
ncbi:glycosyltransferase, partial [Rodentibacter trehalosifermentans]|uniref:glycosyltransferase n=1 Tax=Rodentibacter trehalosifermentans TaxID=1908263 RepID=UPI00117A3AE2